MIMGSVIIVSAVMSLFVSIKGYAKLLWGKDETVDKNTGLVLVVPEKGMDSTQDDEISI